MNTYGPTEATVMSTAGLTVSDGSAPPIGSVLGNVRVFVVDAELRPVPVGVSGELLIGGIGVARGYAGRSELTAERFIADPFSGDGGRLYRSGDVVRWRGDGRLEFVGRADAQVKVRGFRIEPGEIEAVLREHPAIDGAVVVADGDEADRRLVAYLVPVDAAVGVPGVEPLRGFLRDRLPEFMVPAVFVELASLPLNVNGKVDRAALPAPDAARLDLVEAFVAPTGPVQEVLAGIWAELLEVERVGAVDNFFALGGHSLLATRVVSRVRSVFGVEVPVAALFDAPTVAALAAVIEAAVPGAVAPPIVPVGRDGLLPLSFAQQRLWFLAQLEPDSVEYNMPAAIHLDGEVDVPALAAALGGLVARHEVLRTRLVAGEDGVPYQIIDPAPERLELPVVDVSAEPDPVAAAEAWLAADGRVPFDLAAGPLFRATLVRVAADEHVLALAMHHVVGDEWSAGILRNELGALYAGSELPALPVQYADFAVWQRGWLSGEVLEGQLGFWREALAGAPVLELPTDRPRPPVRSSEGSVIEFAIPRAVSDGLRAVARDAGVSMFMTMFGLYTVLLSRYSGQDDIVVGTPIANRNRAEIEGLIGFFVNTLVLRTDVSGDPTFAELLGRVRARTLDAYAHQDLPFEQLVDALDVDRDRSRSPLFQVLFNYFADAERSAEVEDFTQDESVVRPMMAKFDLRLIVAERAGGLVGAVHFASALFDESSMRRLIGHFLALAGAVAAGADGRLSGLNLLTGPEQGVLAGWQSGPSVAVPPVAGVHDLVAGWVQRNPDWPAVVDASGSWTYGQIWQRASGLAGYLRSVGVGPETVVGVAADAGVDVVVSVLGVWLAGGAYLPLDVRAPVSRLAFMLAEGGVSVILGREELLEQVPAGRIRTIDLDDPALTAAAVVPVVRGAVSQAAYVMFTSGSTGRPKGVVVTHAGLLSYVSGVLERVGFGAPGGRYGVLQPAGTDFVNTVLFGGLASGGCLYFADPATVTDPQAVAAFLVEHAIDFVKIVPSHLAGLADGAGLAELLPGRALVLGGEAASPEWLRRLLAVAGEHGVRVANHYGPTETTVGVAGMELTPVVVGGDRVPIGGPLPGARLYVLDQWLQPVPAGVVGELFIGGFGVARGYRGRPELTGERFVADLFAGDGSRMYRSGDRARWRADGTVEFLGRADSQLKVRGYRIEPGEVEGALLAHPGVGAAVVTGHGVDAGRRLVAYVVPVDGMPSVAELRRFLGARLPEHLVPGLFVELAALPLTANGKLDRRALPDPELVHVGPADSYVAPRTPTEETLAAIWAQVLGLGQVGIHDNFFELGGHSLLATQAVARIRGAGYEISVGEFFDQPTIAATAAAVEERSEALRLRAAIEVRRGTADPALFFVHSSNGTVTDFAELAGHLADGQRFIGLQSRGLTDEEEPREAVEDMAAAYLEEVLRIQRDGPHVFAGWSMGAYVALEMAHQLRAAGGDVAAVLLVGPPHHALRRRRVLREERKQQLRLLRSIDEAIAGGPGFEAAIEEILKAWDFDEDGTAAARAGDQQWLRARKVRHLNSMASMRYRTRMARTQLRYDGRVVLFMPQYDPPELQRRTLEQWRMIVPEFEVVDVPGKHLTVVNGESAESVGRWLSAELAGWQRSQDDTPNSPR
ncbi:amino acid adenylation domain-containing protein [Dactylosporangium darangshiense]|uniref:amino acid adenylation domain-containing protein n=3 Tax=Dactylosporangium darangshiense TaxID=579108 RepID=UPI0031F0A681